MNFISTTKICRECKEDTGSMKGDPLLRYLRYKCFNLNIKKLLISLFKLETFVLRFVHVERGLGFSALRSTGSKIKEAKCSGTEYILVL